MVQTLTDKPAGLSVERWFDDVKHSANLNPILNEHPVSVNGLAGLRVRYKSTEPDIEMDVTYLVAGVKTFEISFDGEGQRTRLEDLPKYLVYEAMLTTFRYSNPAAS